MRLVLRGHLRPLFSGHGLRMQHFYAIEGGYRVEQEKQSLDQLARGEPPVAPCRRPSSRSPDASDIMARQLGLPRPSPDR